MNRILTIAPHPDDESSSFGGTLALYAARGVVAEALCITNGEAARNRGAAATPEELAALRRAEFRRACEMLGVTWSEIWDYPDGGLAQVSFLDLGLRLCGVVRARKPDIVLALGPEGGFTGHADHSAASHFAAFAFHAAGRKDLFPECGEPHEAQRLFFATAPAPIAGYARVCFSPVTTEIDIRDTFERKLEAFECHKTQAPLFARFRAAMQKVGPREFFHLASARTPPPPEIARDLLAGLPGSAGILPARV